MGDISLNSWNECYYIVHFNLLFILQNVYLAESIVEWKGVLNSTKIFVFSCLMIHNNCVFKKNHISNLHLQYSLLLLFYLCSFSFFSRRTFQVCYLYYWHIFYRISWDFVSTFSFSVYYYFHLLVHLLESSILSSILYNTEGKPFQKYTLAALWTNIPSCILFCSYFPHTAHFFLSWKASSKPTFHILYDDWARLPLFQ